MNGYDTARQLNKTSLCHTTQLPFRKTLLTSCHHSLILKYESSRPHSSQSIKKGVKATANGMISTNELHGTLFLQHTGLSRAKLLKTSRAAGVSSWDKILRKAGKSEADKRLNLQQVWYTINFTKPAAVLASTTHSKAKTKPNITGRGRVLVETFGHSETL